jgi:hypothetical protein
MHTMIVQYRIALDFYPDCSVKIGEWLSMQENFFEGLDKINEVMKILEVHPEWRRNGLREQCGYVAYDINNDAPCFIFKMDNNGDTFVVSETKVVSEEDEIK